jgi:shikimate dehydrogenase
MVKAIGLPEGNIPAIFGSDPICAVIAAPTCAESARQIRLATGLRGRSRVLELRLDYLRDTVERAALLRWVSRHLARQQSHRASYKLSHPLPVKTISLPPDKLLHASPHRQLPILIATCRTRRGGGQFAGTVEEEIAVLAQAVLAGCHWCDVEIETAERFGSKRLRAALAPAQILVSAHDFGRVPPRVPQLVRRLRRCGGDAVKIAAACRSLADTRRLLAAVTRSRDIVAVPMGTAPRDATNRSGAMRGGASPSDSTPSFTMGAAEDAASRILALREGSALAYASVEQSTAPGQLSLEAVKRVYRLKRVFAAHPPSPVEGAGRAATRVAAASAVRRAGIRHAGTRQAGTRRAGARPDTRRECAPRLGPTHHTRVYGVIGDPIAHSLSPLMHNTAFAVRTMDAIYLPFHVRDAAHHSSRDLRDFLAAVKSFRLSGFSVTLPHKQRILHYLDECEPLAAAVGAVNTVVVRNGKLSGYNTDYVGVLRAIESRVSLPASRVLLIGAGGAARAAAFALSRAGAAVAIWARRKAQARALARAAGGQAIERRALRREFFDAIVNCTPVGMHSAEPAAGGSPLEAAELNCRLVMDLIYRPQKTALLDLAERRGIETISGVEMFLAQGIAQWEIWTGERAPGAAMRRAVVRALAAEERASARESTRTSARTSPNSTVKRAGPGAASQANTP